MADTEHECPECHARVTPPDAVLSVEATVPTAADVAPASSTAPLAAVPSLAGTPYCLHCGKEMTADVHFCPWCGVSVTEKPPSQVGCADGYTAPFPSAAFNASATLPAVDFSALSPAGGFAVPWGRVGRHSGIGGVIGMILYMMLSHGFFFHTGTPPSTSSLDAMYVIRVSGAAGAPFHGSYSAESSTGTSVTQYIHGTIPQNYSVYGHTLSAHVHKDVDDGWLQIDIVRSGVVMKSSPRTSTTCDVFLSMADDGR